jgi:DNA-binding transcriptional LysR family regulator
VTLESATMAAPHLQAGRLVPLFNEQKLVRVQVHCVVYSKRHANRKEVAAVLAWLKSIATPIDPAS